MGAITLGRMNAREALPTLREFGAPEGAYDAPSAACNWAVTEMTEGVFPDSKPIRTTAGCWFLEPLDSVA